MGSRQPRSRDSTYSCRNNIKMGILLSVVVDEDIPDIV